MSVGTLSSQCTMSEYAPPIFSTEALSDSRSCLAWVPDLVLGVDIEDVGHPHLLLSVPRQLRRLQLQFHQDWHSGNEELAR